MVRYSITNCTLRKLESVGVKDVKSTHTGSVFFASMTEDQANQLEKLGCNLTGVSRLKMDQVVTLPEEPHSYYVDEEELPDPSRLPYFASSTPGIAPPPPIEAPDVYSPFQLIEAAGFEEYRQIMDPPLFGEGINIAIIDTGIRATHNLVGESSVIYSENFTIEPDGDIFNHGTGIADILLSASPGCKILDLKIITGTGEGSSEDLILAIDRCVELHDNESEFAPKIINLSLGTDDDGDPNDPIRVVCREALDRGMWVIAAAGNSGPESQSIMNPATEPYVLAVGSMARSPLKISTFSSRGPTVQNIIKPDMVFFGEGIRMASSASDTATVAKNGTSFSVPFVSGIVALHIEAVVRFGGYTTVFPSEDMSDRVRLLTTIQNFIDGYLQQISVKPTEDFVEYKDNTYGWGLPYGRYLANSYSGGTSQLFDFSQIMGPILAIGMMGMVVGMSKRL